jgi:hypothetical protein
METKEALASQDWLNISSESILEFLNMECLNIGEADLLRALIRWGIFQLQQQDKGGENLRIKILPGLRRIRFDCLNQYEFIGLCKEELEEVLTTAEKWSIVKSIITGDWKIMPTDIVSHSELISRHVPYTFISLPYEEDSFERSSGITGETAINFTVNKKATLVGVKLITKYVHPLLKAITLSSSVGSKWTVIGTGCSNASQTSLYRGELFHKINCTQSLDGETWYRLTFTFAPTSEQLGVYTLPKDKVPSHSDGLAVEIMDVYLKCLVNIVGLVFLK